MTDLVVGLEAIDPGHPDTLARVGGKAANLAALVRAAFPVPAGVAVTTTAYRLAVGGTVDPVLDALAGAVPAEVPALAAKARDLVAAVPVPEEADRALRAALPDGPVAVRSSATAEDLPHASFAGQQDTFLHVLGPDAVLDAVRRCWASLWADRAVAYRAATGIDHRAVALAVVVQEMVDARVAGVLFTANPVTGRRREAVVDAAAGLGEAVVSGAVDPEHLVVAPDGTVTERRAGGPGVVVRPLVGGGTESVPVGPDDARLDDPALTRLVALGHAVEDLFGRPQDIEWAQDADGVLWLTQSRPITTLYPRVGPADELRLYLSANVAQGVFGPITPMGRAAARRLGAGVAELLGRPVPDPDAGPPMLTDVGCRLWVDLTEFLRSRVGRVGLRGVLGVMEARSAQIVASQLDRPAFAVTRRSPLPALRRVARVAARHRLPLLALQALRRPAAARARALGVVDARGAELPAPPGATRPERLERVRWMLTHRVAPVVPQLVPAPIVGFLALGLASRLLRGRVRPGELGTVLRGLEHNVTTEMDLALWALADRLRDDPATVAAVTATPPGELARDRDAWPPALADGLGVFLGRWGHRGVAEIDIGVPRWRDDPAPLLGVLANYLRLDGAGAAPDAVFARGAGEAEAAVRDLAGRVGGLRGRVVAAALRTTRELVGLRELPKYWLVTVLGAARTELLAVGADLVAGGWIDRAEDVFFLDLDEAGRGADHRALVRERRAEHEYERLRRHVPRIVLSDGTEPEALLAGPVAEGALVGTPASAGVATGPVRVVLDPADAHLDPGDVLVCPSTDPGWTPLFLTAGALVMEMGGANSHGAVVAREYGLPAVVGVRDAVARLQDAATARVDGTTGTVEAV